MNQGISVFTEYEIKLFCHHWILWNEFLIFLWILNILILKIQQQIFSERKIFLTLTLLLFVIPYPHTKYVGDNTVNFDLSYKTREEEFLQ